jgi:hypothetical protein
MQSSMCIPLITSQRRRADGDAAETGGASTLTFAAATTVRANESLDS